MPDAAQGWAEASGTVGWRALVEASPDVEPLATPDVEPILVAIEA